MGLLSCLTKGNTVKSKNGNDVTLLDPSAKAGKFASELKDNQHYTKVNICEKFKLPKATRKVIKFASLG